MSFHLPVFSDVPQLFALQRLPNAVHFLCDNPDWKQALMDGKKSSANDKERKADNLFSVDA